MTMTNTMQKRMALFLIGCMGTRLTLVWFAYSYPSILWYMGLIALIPAIGFFVIYFGGLRKTGAEVFGESIWWNHLRPVHGLLYLLFAYLALNKAYNLQQHAWKVLLLDTIIGLVAFVHHHFM